MDRPAARETAFLALCPSNSQLNRHRIPRRRTAAAAAAAVPGASAQSLLRALLGRRVVRESKEEDGGGGSDPVRFPSRFTRRLKLDDDDEGDEEEGIDDVDEGENKSRLISQVRKAYSTVKSLSNGKELFDFLSFYGSVSKVIGHHLSKTRLLGNFIMMTAKGYEGK